MGLLHTDRPTSWWVSCDVHGCGSSNGPGHRETVEGAEALVLSQGWVRSPDGKWFCPAHQNGGGLKVYYWDLVTALQNHAEGYVFAVASTKEQAIELACSEWFDYHEPCGEPVFTGMTEKYPGWFDELRASHRSLGLRRQAEAVEELRAELQARTPQILSVARAIVIPGSS